MLVLPHDVMEAVGSFLTSIEPHLGVAHSATARIRLGGSDWAVATQKTEQALEEWAIRMGFPVRLRTILNGNEERYLDGDLALSTS